MPHSGRFARERWRDRWQEPGIEHEIERHARVQQSSRWARLWVPVIISLFVQVPGSFVHVVPGHGLERVTESSLGWFVLSLAITLVGPIVLIGARRWPGPVIAVTAAAASADILLFHDVNRPPYVALAFALVSSIVRGARLWAWISVAAAWVLVIAIALLGGLDLPPQRIAAITLGILIVMGLGEAVRTRRDNFLEFSRRFAERKQSEVQAERVRIARELHDVLAHSLSQINVQASVGLHLMDTQPDKAKDALASIKESSKSALDEVRSMLGVLRAEDGADPGAPLVPEPDLSRLAGLAASIEAQGIAVDVHNRISSPPPAPAQLALYRIAQESLTNVLRHAKATRVTVLAEQIDGEYRLTVTDNGTGVPVSTNGGRGLLGMHERADLLGGTLEAGPRAVGGFEVRATIPTQTQPGTKDTP
ncbi:sensor histidine kinase [Lacisediminihabitans changchengi]|uniref:histidine kinase n=1 Tax=Lacisediminihabitans changchengi TaxID=2787634 RepID=A0A934SKL2_9MICO|nr:sensor histidine kinase [Lacisediminihabitans changchengi]MBK4346632.1 sensor histidine kinase [Lacisediminihabitans changchengi]